MKNHCILCCLKRTKPIVMITFDEPTETSFEIYDCFGKTYVTSLPLLNILTRGHTQYIELSNNLILHTIISYTFNSIVNCIHYILISNTFQFHFTLCHIEMYVNRSRVSKTMHLSVFCVHVSLLKHGLSLWETAFTRMIYHTNLLL